MTTQQKISKCLELALQIEGANFDYHPDSESVTVFAWSTEVDVNGVRKYLLYYSAYTSPWSEKLSIDNLIGQLEKHIKDHA